MKPGDRYRVKSTAVLRRYGIRTYGTFQAKGDDHVWPGDSGTVVERRWTPGSGPPSSGLWLEFSRGRSLCVDTLSTESRKDFALVRFVLDDVKHNK